MYQRWCDLLFLHWEYPIAALQETLPDGLRVDTYDGKAYLGVVPFFMRDVRPRRLPSIPRISHFMELNLRTYVYDEAGVPGVWFYSLDANQRLAVEMARRFFHLPYEHARMKASRTAEGTVRYQSTRRGASAGCEFAYAPGAVLAPAAPETLEFFLIERYRLYSLAKGRLFRGAVGHQPYPLCCAEVSAWDEKLLPLDGFAATGRAPDHVIMSRGVEVAIFPLEEIVKP